MADPIIDPETKGDHPPQNVGETLEVGQGLSADAKQAVTDNLGLAANLAEKAGGIVAPLIQDIGALRQELDETSASFEARIKRLQSPYVLSPELEKVLEVAEILEKPLLLEGEPGTGKTSLAYALAGHKDLPIIHAQCTSTTTAEKLLYSIDEIGRFRDAQAGKDVSDLSKYVRLGPLGKAFGSQVKVILLIDEVDKAKREFTNDLLHELDQMSFFIPETGQEVSARLRPIVIITSNHERDLPEPVFRRCVYEYIEFPTPEQMAEIVRAHVPNVDEKLLEQASVLFYDLRKTEGLEKKPSTSEMLDWMNVLIKFGITDLSGEKDIPFLNTLIKTKEDLLRLTEDQLDLVKVPFELSETLAGNKVVRINKDHEKENILYSLLANEGFIFNKDSFRIHGDGIKQKEYAGDWRDLLTFSLDLSAEDAEKLYSLLLQKELIVYEFGVSENPIDFVKIENATETFVKGEDEFGYIFFKTTDGQFVSQVFPEVVNDANVPISDLKLEESQANALRSAGIGTVSDLITKLTEGGETGFFNWTGLGRKSLIDIRKAIRNGGYKIMEKPADSEELGENALLGESTLAKLRPKDEQ